jgi:hypothetical protein
MTLLLTKAAGAPYAGALNHTVVVDWMLTIVTLQDKFAAYCVVAAIEH